MDNTKFRLIVQLGVLSLLILMILLTASCTSPSSIKHQAMMNEIDSLDAIDKAWEESYINERELHDMEYMLFEPVWATIICTSEVSIIQEDYEVQLSFINYKDVKEVYAKRFADTHQIDVKDVDCTLIIRL